MKKGILLIIATGIIIGSALIPGDKTYSNSGVTPPGYTNAPGDQTCAKSGCHSDGVVSYNDGSISVASVPPNALAGGYTANTLYHLDVNMSAAATYGFQLTAVNDAGSGIGTFALTDTNHTVLTLDNTNSRYYVGSKNDGNAALAFEWTAPASGNVYFYLAVVDGNGDGTANGDQVKLKEYKLTTSSFEAVNESAGISSPINADEAGIKIFPNPVKDQLNLTYAAPANELVKADIYSINGQLVMPLFEENGAGHTTKSININNQLSSGIYIVRMSIGTNSYFKKILVQE